MSMNKFFLNFSKWTVYFDWICKILLSSCLFFITKRSWAFSLQKKNFSNWYKNFSNWYSLVASTTDNELGCKVLDVTKWVCCCWCCCCCWVFWWEGWRVKLSTKLRSVCEKGIIGPPGGPTPGFRVSSKADVGVKVADDVGGGWTPCKWSGVWNPPPELGPLKSQEVPEPLPVPGFIIPDPLEPGDNWLSSRNLKLLIHYIN